MPTSEEQLRMKEEEVLRVREMARMRELNKLANMHHLRSHLYYRGFYPWLQLLRHRHMELEKAGRWYEDGVVDKAWLSWKDYVMECRKERRVEWEQKVRQRGGGG